MALAIQKAGCLVWRAKACAPIASFLGVSCNRRRLLASAALPAARRDHIAGQGQSNETTPLRAPDERMAWNDFFKARSRIKLIKRLGGIPFALSFFMAEGALLTLPIFDPTQTIMEVDPMVIVGMASVLGSIAAYFAGAAMTGITWRCMNKGKAQAMDLCQKDFYSRISKHRANVPPNPTQMNFSFDYYGERIASVADYRGWLRRQRKLLSDRIFPVK